jgi:hypothetical protein
MNRFGRQLQRLVVMGLALGTAVAFTISSAGAQSPPPQANPAEAPRFRSARLEHLLRVDGSVDLTNEWRGSLSASGWRIRLDEDDAPRFTRADEDGPRRPGKLPGRSAAAPDPADVNWDERFVLPNGVDNNGTTVTVTALAADGAGNLYVGGWFSAAGAVNAYSVAKWDGVNWSALGSGMDSPVNALAVDGAGNLYAGGDFWEAGGGGANGVAKWDGTNWSPLGSGIQGGLESVSALVVDGAGNLYGGGSFETAGGVSAMNVAKWDGTSWSALGSGIGSSASSVYALALDGAGNLYAGGVFIAAGGVSARNIAKWDGTNWSALGSGVNATIDALAVDGAGNVYAGGTFSKAGDVTAYGAAKWDGTNWSALGSGMDYRVYAVATDGAGNVYAAGAMTKAGGVSANRVAKWDGTSWSALGTGMDWVVRALLVDDSGDLWAGGEFGVAGGKAANHVARWDGSDWWAPGSGAGSGVNSIVICLVSDGAGHLYAGGAFSAAGGVVANHVARWNGASWSALGTGTSADWYYDGVVHALATDTEGNLYAGGSFTTAGGVSANHVAKWDGADWSALGPGISGMRGSVISLVVDRAGNLYASAVAGGTDVWKWDGANWSALGTGLNSIVWSLVVDRAGTLYAGGWFTMVSGVSANHVAKWDGTSWSALGSGLNGEVQALALDDSGNLFAGGWFTTAGGVSARNVAKWDGTSWSALGPGVAGAVYAMALDRAGNLYTGAPAAEVGVGAGSKWDGTSWSTLGSGMNDIIDALAVDEVGNVFAGGYFTRAGGKVSSHIALWHVRHTITATAGPGGSIAPSGAVTVKNGEDQTFAITPGPGYQVADVLVDGSSVGPVTSYTFSRVTADHTIAASFCVGLTFELMPEALNPASQGRWVTAFLQPPAPYRASQIDVASIRLNGIVPISPDYPAKIEDKDTRLQVKFERAEVARTLTPGADVSVRVSGTIAEMCFAGTDHLRVTGTTMERTAARTGNRAESAGEADGARTLLALRPSNPVIGALTVSFSLESAAPAVLAVFDISGRQVLRREVGSSGPGWHSVRLGDLPTGMYAVRLSQGGRSVSSRVVAIR